jgi:hypothetical protein
VLGARSLEQAWSDLASRPYPAWTTRLEPDLVEALEPGERARVLAAGERAAARELELLGSEPFQLRRPADWLTDPKTGRRWEPGWARGIEYANLDAPSDVKLPWEISRLGWLVPAGQAYVLTGEERYAEAAAELLDDWITANPHARTVNWACTMEPALRAIVWTWLFHVFHGSSAWADPGFRERFLATLYLHGDYTSRHLERSDVNGNHYTADAAGLVFAGLFFGGGSPPACRWADTGWAILRAELPRQVFPDGVDFEASTAYHRLVAELFLLPALYRQAAGLDVSGSYRERLLAMAHFSSATIRPDGTVPHWGDEDDARALPLGGQALDDHRYLSAAIQTGLGGAAERLDGPGGEILWLYGPDTLQRLRDAPTAARSNEPAMFPHGGAYVLRGERDHVFVDCGPVGLAGRGGHGHNDITSVDATLDGVPLLLDPGTFTYTASREWRNRFRSTAFHNAVQVDGHELNRFGDPDHLWSLRDDARPVDPGVTVEGAEQTFRGGHTGYLRLPDPVSVTRTVQLDVERHRLLVLDVLDANAEHEFSARFTLPAAASVEVGEDGATIVAADRVFDVRWSGWRGSAGRGWVSPSYGVKHEASTLDLRARGRGARLAVAFAPAGDAAELEAWLDKAIAG